ncbi:MAG: hypothetical protein RLZZ76_155 [Candidatus Parcubacteria bacterium]|jgi:hypothetical protein
MDQQNETVSDETTQLSSNIKLSKYLVFFLLVTLPFFGFWLGNKFSFMSTYSNVEATIVSDTDNKQVTPVIEDKLDTSKVLETKTSLPMHKDSGQKSGTTEDTLLNENKKNIQEAIDNFTAQELYTIEVIDTPIEYVKVVVAANKQGGVYCGYDNGPCYFFLQSYNADYPNGKYLGQLDGYLTVDFSKIKFISPEVFEIVLYSSVSKGDGSMIERTVQMDITTGELKIISEQLKSQMLEGF